MKLREINNLVKSCRFANEACKLREKLMVAYLNEKFKNKKNIKQKELIDYLWYQPQVEKSKANFKCYKNYNGVAYLEGGYVLRGLTTIDGYVGEELFYKLPTYILNKVALFNRI